MKNLNWLEAVKRAYLFLWVIWAAVMTFALIDEGASLHKVSWWFLAVAVVPTVIYIGANWIFKGLNDNQDTNGT